MSYKELAQLTEYELTREIESEAVVEPVDEDYDPECDEGDAAAGIEYEEQHGRPA